MKKHEISLKHEFVEFIPAKIEEGKLYISIPYATAAHRCCCGCGNEVITPLSPTDWKIIFDGQSVSLDPSIGNWSFNCQSHYWIKKNRVAWAEAWSKELIDTGRTYDRAQKEQQYQHDQKQSAFDEYKPNSPKPPEKSLWSKLKDLLPFKG